MSQLDGILGSELARLYELGAVDWGFHFLFQPSFGVCSHQLCKNGITTNGSENLSASRVAFRS